MIYLKITLTGNCKEFWVETNCTKLDQALERGEGIVQGIGFCTGAKAVISDTRLSKHPTEPLYSQEIIQQLIKEFQQ